VLLVHCGGDCTHLVPSTTSAASHHIFLSLPITKRTALREHGSYVKCSTPNLKNEADFSSKTCHHLHKNVVSLPRWSQPNLLLPQENNVISICTIDFYGN
jgi:hypothetical protein